MLLNCGAGEDSWTARSIQSILKEINPDYSLEGLMLKLKLQYFGLLMQRTDSLEKTLMLRKAEGRRRKEQQRIRCLDAALMQRAWVEQAPGAGQGSLDMLQSMVLQSVRHEWGSELIEWGKETFCFLSRLCHFFKGNSSGFIMCYFSILWPKFILLYFQFRIIQKKNLHEN